MANISWAFQSLAGARAGQTLWTASLLASYLCPLLLAWSYLMLLFQLEGHRAVSRMSAGRQAAREGLDVVPGVCSAVGSGPGGNAARLQSRDAELALLRATLAAGQACDPAEACVPCTPGWLRAGARGGCAVACTELLRRGCCMVERASGAGGCRGMVRSRLASLCCILLETEAPDCTTDLHSLRVFSFLPPLPGLAVPYGSSSEGISAACCPSVGTLSPGPGRDLGAAAWLHCLIPSQELPALSLLHGGKGEGEATSCLGLFLEPLQDALSQEL